MIGSEHFAPFAPTNQVDQIAVRLFPALLDQVGVRLFPALLGQVAVRLFPALFHRESYECGTSKSSSVLIRSAHNCRISLKLKMHHPKWVFSNNELHVPFFADYHLGSRIPKKPSHPSHPWGICLLPGHLPLGSRHCSSRGGGQHDSSVADSIERESL